MHDHNSDNDLVFKAQSSRQLSLDLEQEKFRTLKNRRFVLKQPAVVV